MQTVARGDAIPLAGLTLDVLNPPPVALADNNEDSLVVQLTCGRVDLLITGDAGSLAETSMLAAGVVGDVDVLRAGHHGSQSSTTPEFIAVTDPEFAVVSVGRDNPYGHPHPEVLDRLTASGAAILVTDRTAGDDTITMTSDCQSFAFE